jgi:hypothetical protein
MLRLGSILLTAVLLGVPRALEARAFGSTRAVHVDVAPQDPELASFAEELDRALAAATHTLAPRPFPATLVVEVHGFARSAPAGEGIRHAVLVSQGRGRTFRPLILDHGPGQRAQAARALIEALPNPR